MEDFNKYEMDAKRLIELKNYLDAQKIYYTMADGDPSLDAGYLAERIGFCYEMMGNLPASRYWYGVAIQENPEIYGALKDRNSSDQ